MGHQSSSDSIMFALVLNPVFSASISLGGIMVLTELGEKSAQRYFSAGITPNCFFVGLTLVGAVLLSLSGYCGLIYCLWIRSLETKGSNFLAIALIFSQSLVGTLFGQIIGLMFRSKILVVSFLTSYSVISISCQGLVFSIESQPYFLKWISYFLPSTLSLESLRAMYQRDLGIKSPRVFDGFIVSFTYILLFGLISRRSFNKLGF